MTQQVVIRIAKAGNKKILNYSMKLFAALVTKLGTSTKTNDKLDALVKYFAAAHDKDKVWIIAIFSGRRPRRSVSGNLLATWSVELIHLPFWLFEESYHVVGDLAETIALLLPESTAEKLAEESKPLHFYIERLKAIEKEHSKKQCEKIVKYVGGDKDRFAQLMQLFLKGGYRITQRAGWPLSICVEKHPELITPWFKQILPLLKKPGVHIAVVRNVVRLLQYVAIPKRFHGQVMNDCFEFIADNNTAPAIKAFSLAILENLSAEYPDIKPELKLIIEERWPYETAAFHSRAKKILKKL